MSKINNNKFLSATKNLSNSLNKLSNQLESIRNTTNQKIARTQKRIEMPREYTREEVQDMFFEHLNEMINYWRIQKDSDGNLLSPKKMLEGLTFSFLCMLDGVTELPAFLVIPLSYKENVEYYKEVGENYFRELPEEFLTNIIDVHGSDTLHEKWSRRDI